MVHNPTDHDMSYEIILLLVVKTITLNNMCFKHATFLLMFWKLVKLWKQQYIFFLTSALKVEFVF